MCGEQPSDPAAHAATVFREAGADYVPEPGVGHGRDALYFAREGFTPRHRLQPGRPGSAAGRRLRRAGRGAGDDHGARRPGAAAAAGRLGGRGLRAHAAVHGAVDQGAPHPGRRGPTRTATRRDLRLHRPAHGRRLLRRGHRARGDVWEHGGFAVRSFPRDLVDALADGCRLAETHAFEEGGLPRRSWRVTQTLPRWPPAGSAGRRSSGPASPYARFELDMNSRLTLDPTAPAATVPARGRAQDEAAPAGR